MDKNFSRRLAQYVVRGEIFASLENHRDMPLGYCFASAFWQEAIWRAQLRMFNNVGGKNHDKFLEEAANIGAYNSVYKESVEQCELSIQRLRQQNTQ